MEGLPHRQDENTVHPKSPRRGSRNVSGDGGPENGSNRHLSKEPDKSLLSVGETGEARASFCEMTVGEETEALVTARSW